MYLLVQHNKLTKFTKVSMGKHIATVKGKKLGQDEIWPIVLVCTDLNLKIEVTYDSRCGLFEVKANGVPYLSLPYIAPNHNYFDE